MSQIQGRINESSPKNFLQYAFKVRQRRPIIEIGQSIPPNDLVYFLLGLLEFVGVKYHREHECMHRRYGLKFKKVRVSHRSHISSALTVSSAAKEISCSITHQIAEEERDVVPASSVPADPLISSSSSADIQPLESRWESSSVDVYDGTAVPDL